MQYISTRGTAPVLSFADALMAGLALDGGLYVPASYPQITAADIRSFRGLSYAEVAERVIRPFVAESIDGATLSAMISDAYACFQHSAVAPLHQLEANHFALELFHGPTLAFKDIAMQLVARMMNHFLRLSGQRATIVTATSGDTGAAAVHAFKGLDNIDLFVLYPDERVSEVQRRQMTTADADNVHIIRLQGTFDDCQAIVKGMFNNHVFRNRLNLSGVNSINWARIVAQTAYYFTSAVSLGAPDREVSFSVPTGNFGDVFAGYVAKQMGLPIKTLVVATNENDILVRAIGSGSHGVRQVVATQSPSMDIQVSSNFERLLFDSYDRSASEIRGLMGQLRQRERAFEVAPEPLRRIQSGFVAHAVSEEETSASIKEVFIKSSYVVDPHTAIGVAAARPVLAADPSVPMVTLATAHPAKFPDSVQRAIDVWPKLPAHLEGLNDASEISYSLANDQRAIEEFVERRSRVTNKVVPIQRRRA